MSEINFGKYIVIEPHKHHFEKMSKWYWEIKAPTSGDELAITRFFNRGKVTKGFDSSITRDAPPTWIEIMYREIALLFLSTNIPSEDDKPILAAGASVAQVEATLRTMPHAMVLEIFQAIGDMVIGWGRVEMEEEPKEGDAPEEGEDGPNLKDQESD